MSQDIQNELRNPLERLAVLPNMMSWRGEWNIDDEYYQNNVVTDPINTGSYIYTGFSAAIRGGDPPSQVIGPSIWTAFGSTVAAGVQLLKEGEGILIDGSDTIPTVSNTGVLTVSTDGGLQNIGTNQFPVLTLGNALSQVQGGLGITIDNTNPNQPKIDNSGVLNIFPGAGISVTGQNDLTVANTGVVSISVAPGTALTITNPGQNPTINNTGLASITPDNVGIELEPGRPANEPQLNNTGVISIRPNNIIVTGSGNNILSMFNPVKSLVFNAQNLVMTPPFMGGGAPTDATIPITQTLGTFWESVWNNGPPFGLPSGTFLMNFSLKFRSYMPPTSGGTSAITLSIWLQDNTNGLVEIGPFQFFSGIGTNNFPFRTFVVTDIAVNVNQNLGFRRLTGLRLQITRIGGPVFAALTLDSSGPCYATWFNQNVPFPYPQPPIPPPPMSPPPIQLPA